MRGVGIFDHELAREVRREFEHLMDTGLSAYAAANGVLSRHAAQVHDPDDEPAIYFALVELQLNCGALAPSLRKRVLTLINSGDSLARWAAQPEETIEARKKVEQDLRRRLVQG